MKRIFDFLMVRTSGPSVQVQNEKTFIQVFRSFNERDARHSNHAKKTREKYENFADNFERYLAKNSLQDLPVSALKISILEDFLHWLPLNLKRCGKTHSAKHIERIKKVCDYAVRMEMIPFNPVASFKVKRDEAKEVISLEDEELNKWVAAVWDSPAYNKAKDLYTFQAYTGLSYMDLFTYKTVNNKNGIWIEDVRGKTGKPYYVPLWHPDFKTALEIHEKHEGKLPYMENHYYNRVIREMAGILGITKYLTSHTGRKTFATIKDQNGWELGPISSMLGNTESIARKHYIRTSKNKIEAQILRIGNYQMAS